MSDDNKDDEDEDGELECCVCGIIFTVPTNFKALKRRTGKQFWCPNGHSLFYTKPKEEDDDDDDTEDNEQLESLKKENEELKVSVRKLKCRLLGVNSIPDKIKVWWKGGLVK